MAISTFNYIISFENFLIIIACYVFNLVECIELPVKMHVKTKETKKTNNTDIVICWLLMDVNHKYGSSLVPFRPFIFFRWNADIFRVDDISPRTRTRTEIRTRTSDGPSIIIFINDNYPRTRVRITVRVRVRGEMSSTHIFQM